MDKKYKRFYVFLAITAFIVLFLHKIGPYEGQLRLVGFILFTILCIGLAVENKESKAKMIGVIIFFLVFGVGGYF